MSEQHAESVRCVVWFSAGAASAVTAKLAIADTGWEPQAVYDHLLWLETEAIAAGIQVHRVANGNLRADALDPTHRFASMPLFVRNRDGSKGMVRRQCTSEYKIKPIERKLRELVGIKARQRPKGVLVEQWMGISWDEMQRMSDPSFPWIIKRYPLVDLRMTRHNCKQWLARRGVDAPRSACLGCPFHVNDEWRSIRDKDPAGWADAVQFDAAIRAGNVPRAPNVNDGVVPRNSDKLLGQAYLHGSLRPLDLVDLSTREDHGQGSLFDTECAGVCGV